MVTLYRETDFKDTEIGRIPKEWKVVKLIDVCNLIRGTEPGSKTYNTEGIGHRFIRVSDISKQVLESVFTTEDKNKLVFCKKDDILLALDGVPGVVGRGFEGAISSGIRIISPKFNNLDKDFLFYILQHKCVQKVIESYTTGTTIKHASRAIDFIKIPLPPLEEQKAIAKILSTIDKAIDKTEEIITRTEKLKKGLMKILLTRGIGHKDFKDTEIGRIPKEWKVVKLIDVCNLIRGTEPGSKTYNTEGIGHRFIRVSDISKQVLESVFTTEDKNKLVFCKKDDILLALDGVPGAVSRGFEGAISSGIRIVEPKTNNLKKDFLFYVLQYEYVQKVIESYTTGTTIKHASKAINFIYIPLPPLEEQKAIAEILSTVDKKIELERKRKEKLEKIKKGLMNLLITGKIRVKIK